MVERTDMSETRCRGCGTKVLFGIDDQGTDIILDSRRHPIYVQENIPILGEVWTRVDGARLSHFVTCTKRDDCKRTARPTPGS